MRLAEGRRDLQNQRLERPKFSSGLNRLEEDVDILKKTIAVE